MHQPPMFPPPATDAGAPPAQPPTSGADAGTPEAPPPSEVPPAIGEDASIGDVTLGLAPRALCHAPHIADGALGSCGTQASSDLANGGASSAAANAAMTCMAKSFEAEISKLCGKASELCAQVSAAAELCSLVSEACSDLADAGL
jgi:hypothetical protein